MGTKNNPGRFDCYEAADPNEPMFVLLARDYDAPRLVLSWADQREAADGPSEKVEEARACARAMWSWVDEREQHAAAGDGVYALKSPSERRCDTCNRPVGPTDMQYERDGAVWCETHMPAEGTPEGDQ